MFELDLFRVELPPDERVLFVLKRSQRLVPLSTDIVSNRLQLLLELGRTLYVFHQEAVCVMEVEDCLLFKETLLVFIENQVEEVVALFVEEKESQGVVVVFGSFELQFFIREKTPEGFKPETSGHDGEDLSVVVLVLGVVDDALEHSFVMSRIAVLGLEVLTASGEQNSVGLLQLVEEIVWTVINRDVDPAIVMLLEPLDVGGKDVGGLGRVSEVFFDVNGNDCNDEGLGVRLSSCTSQ